ATEGGREHLLDTGAAVHERAHEPATNALAQRFADVAAGGAEIVALIQCRSELHRQSHRRAVTTPLEREPVPVLQQANRAVELTLCHGGTRPRDGEDLVARRHRLMWLETRAAAEQAVASCKLHRLLFFPQQRALAQALGHHMGLQALEAGSRGLALGVVQGSL